MAYSVGVLVHQDNVIWMGATFLIQYNWCNWYLYTAAILSIFNMWLSWTDLIYGPGKVRPGLTNDDGVGVFLLSAGVAGTPPHLRGRVGE